MTQSVPAEVSFDISDFFQKILKNKEIESGLFDISFVSVEMICELHQAHLSDPSPTDIITFHLSDAPLSVDLYICPEIAKKNAQTHQFTYDNEIKLLLIHGLLHCIGFDDLSEFEYDIMNTEQHRILNDLNHG